MLIRQNTPPKSPTTLTNEQVEAWMRANPDRVQRLDNTDYDHSVVKQIKVKIFLERRACSRTLTLSKDDLRDLIQAVEKTDERL